MEIENPYYFFMKVGERAYVEKIVPLTDNQMERLLNTPYNKLEPELTRITGNGLFRDISDFELRMAVLDLPSQRERIIKRQASESARDGR